MKRLKACGLSGPRGFKSHPWRHCTRPNVTWGRLMSLHEKSCGAVVFKRDGEVQYLLLHYEAGHWDYVKGQVEPHES